MYDRTKIHHPSAVHPRFNLGRVWTTHAAQAASGVQRRDCLSRHVRADWGIVSGEVARANEGALRSARPIRSAYAIDPAKPCTEVDNCLWVVTAGGETFVGLPNEFEFGVEGTLVP